MKKPRAKSNKAGAIRDRAAKTAAVVTPGSPLGVEAVREAAKPPFNPMKFFQEVRAEAKKITWTSRRETWITAVMVFIMVAITAAFFKIVDFGLGAFMAGVFKLANPGS